MPKIVESPATGNAPSSALARHGFISFPGGGCRNSRVRLHRSNRAAWASAICARRTSARRFPQLVGRIHEYLEQGPSFYAARAAGRKVLPDDLRLMLLGTRKHLGTAVSQSREGDHIGDVRDFAYRRTAVFRGYQTGEVASFIATPAMLRRCSAAHGEGGGISLVCSSIAIQMEMLRTHPYLAEALYQPMPWSMLDQQRR